jgi:hypothetical protein
MLLGDIARLRERGVVPSATTAAGGSVTAGNSPHATPPASALLPGVAGLNAAAAAVVDTKLQEVDAAIARWESQYPAAVHCIAAVQALALKLRQI